MVFSKSYCSYCDATKRLLSQNNIAFKALELDTRDDGPSIQSLLQKKTGQRTVPNVFIRGKHIGGNSDLMALHGKGELKV